MSGHSKWATIKHKKGAADKARGKLFAKLARQIEVAARAGGGDPDTNPTLRTAVQKAKGAQMTNDAIDRAIKRGTGEGDTTNYESITYEGYAPGGVAMLIEVLTDNRNRTGAEVRGVFSKLGGSMAEPGSVSWQFCPSRCHRGRRLGRRGRDDDGGDRRRCRRHLAGRRRLERLHRAVEGVRRASGAGDRRVHRDSADTPLVSDNLVPIESVEEARKVLRIVEAFEDNDDVQDVYTNFDIAESVMNDLVEAG